MMTARLNPDAATKSKTKTTPVLCSPLISKSLQCRTGRNPARVNGQKEVNGRTPLKLTAHFREVRVCFPNFRMTPILSTPQTLDSWTLSDLTLFQQSRPAHKTDRQLSVLRKSLSRTPLLKRKESLSKLPKTATSLNPKSRPMSYSTTPFSTMILMNHSLMILQ